MKTTQINITVGCKIAYGYGGGIRYEITEIVDLDPEDDRDLVLKGKRIDITRDVYDHARQMLDRLDRDEIARAEAKK